MDLLQIDGELSIFYHWTKSDVDNLEMYLWKYYYDNMVRKVEDGNNK